MATDRPKTFKDLVEAAEQGDPRAQFELGRRHFRGDGTPQDRAEAERWLRRAVQGGHDVARIYLSELRGRPNQPLGRDQGRGADREQGFERWLDGAVTSIKTADNRRGKPGAAEPAAALLASPLAALRRLFGSRYLPAMLLGGLLAYLLLRLAQTGSF
jgi:TPR repeat protein